MTDRSGILSRISLCLIFCIALMINSSLLPAVAVAGEIQWIIKPVFEHAENFNEGMAPVMTGGKYGYINMSGEFVIKPEYDEAGDFYEGIAPVIKNGLKTYINNKGFTVIAVKEDESRYSGEGYVVVKIDGRYGYLMSSGKIALEPLYEDALSFNEGVAAVKIGGKYGFINKKGKIIIRPVFEDASVFSEGLAAVKVRGAWGYINKRGLFVIKPSFYDARDFSSGLAHVRVESGFGYISNKGKFIINPQFESASPFSEKTAAVKSGGKWGYIKMPEVRKQGVKKTLRAEKVLRKSKKIKDLLPGKAGDKNGDSIKLKENDDQRSAVSKKTDSGKIWSGSRSIDRNSSAENEQKKIPVTPENKKSDYKPEFSARNGSESDDYSIPGKMTADAPVIKGMVYAGILSEVNQGQVVVTDSASGVKYYMGAWCIIGVEDDRVYIEAGTPFSAVAKCDFRNGFYEKIKPGMKVYKKIK